MSKGRTLKRTPMTVDPDDYELRKSYFNFSSYGGINDNKNYVNVNQYSFEDANNVYVDQDSQLHTRPPVKEITIEVFNANEYCIGLDKVNNITFYHTVENSTYRWRWKYNGTWYSCHSTETSKVIFITDTIIVFNTDSMYGFRWDFEESKYKEYSAEDLIYIPIDSANLDGSSEEAESENIFGGGTLTRYLFEYGNVLGTDTIKLVGETVSVKIGDKAYSVTLQLGTPIVFVDQLSRLSLTSVTVYSSYQESMLIYDGDSRNLYFSVDGETFSIFSMPTSNADEKCVCLAKDGSQIIVVDPTPVQNYIGSTLEYTYDLTVYYMSSPSTSGSGGTWSSTTLNILKAYASPASMYTNYVGSDTETVKSLDDNVRIYNYRLSAIYSSVITQNKIYVSMYYEVNSLSIAKVVCPEENEIVVVGTISLQGYHYSFDNDGQEYLAICPPANGENAAYGAFQTNFIGRIYEDSSSLTSSMAIGGVFMSYTVGEGYRDKVLSMFGQIKEIHYADYVAANNFNVVVMRATVEAAMARSNTGTTTINTTELECFVYHIINSDDGTMFMSKGAYWDSETELDGVWGPYCPTNIYCIPMITCRMYQFGSYTGATTNGDNMRGDTTSFTFVDSPYPSQLYYTDGVLNYTQLGYAESSGNYTHYTFKLSCTLAYIDNYDAEHYSNLINFYNIDDFDGYDDIYDNYNLYPICFTETSSLVGSENNQAPCTKTEITTVSYTFSYGIYTTNGDILTDKYYYYQSTVYELLNKDDNLIPLYTERVTLTNNTTYGKILYYNLSDSYVYTNEFEGYAYIDVIEDGEINYYVPSFYEDFITTTIAIDNKLYQSTTVLDDDDGHPKIYFPKDSEVTFVDKITNLVIFSTTSLGVFLENLVYEYTYSSDNDYYTLTPTKLQLGCKDGADIITSYDGATIYITNLKGLASLSYEDFVQSDEQVYEYMTENIMSLYDEFKGDNKIKLYQYKDWLWMYRQDSTEIYLYDTRTSIWWKWTLPYAIQKLIYNEEDLIFVQSDNRLVKFDFDGSGDFTDLDGTEISWNFKSQKLHFSAPNHYKHIYQLNVVTAQSDDEVRYKLRFINYRNLNNLEDCETVAFDIMQLTTLIKRVTFMKTNAFQFEISNDDTDSNPKHFETSNIAIKYRVTMEVR